MAALSRESVLAGKHTPLSLVYFSRIVRLFFITVYFVDCRLGERRKRSIACLAHVFSGSGRREKRNSSSFFLHPSGNRKSKS